MAHHYNTYIVWQAEWIPIQLTHKIVSSIGRNYFLKNLNPISHILLGVCTKEVASALSIDLKTVLIAWVPHTIILTPWHTEHLFYVDIP